MENCRFYVCGACFSAASNVTGVKTDYKRIYSLVKKFGGVVAFDCAATSSHEILDAAYFDAAFFSPHKLLGGVGSCGLLAIKKELYTRYIPIFAGGGTIALATPSKHLFIKNAEQLEEAGTPSILGLVRASLAYNLQASVGVENIKAREDELANFFGSSVCASFFSSSRSSRFFGSATIFLSCGKCRDLPGKRRDRRPSSSLAGLSQTSKATGRCTLKQGILEEHLFANRR